MPFGKTVFACLLALLATQRVEAATKLTLSCKGEVTTTVKAMQSPWTEKDTIGLVLDFTSRTASLEGDTVPLTLVNNTIIDFLGTKRLF
ncbi:MAG: hypothetical protein P8Y71_29200 [Pseudolabrys sp.]